MSRVALPALPLVACVLLAAPAPADAQSRWHEQVNAQIERAAKFLNERGYHRTHDVYTGSVKNEESDYLTLTLHAGTAYAIIAVCDNDCSDIDLRIFNEDDKELDSDVENDDNPIVTVVPTSDGKFRLKVIMAKCTTSPCFFGVGVYGK
jgi:hypothetical protein